MSSCLFCKIIEKNLPAQIMYEDDHVLGFYDIHPQAPVHLLLIPKIHLENMNQVTGENSHWFAKLFEVASIIAKKLHLETDGYRLVCNTGPLAGQSVYHVHVHLLAGRQLEWPPG